jgi:hypothetical protein
MVEKKRGFFAAVLNTGMLLTIWGKMRSGKTSFACYLMEIAAEEKGFNVYTNIPFFRFEQKEEAIGKGYLLPGVEYHLLPKEIQTTRRCSELLRGLFVTSKNLVVLDEAALFAASSMGTSTKVRWLKSLIFTIGKLDSAVIVIAQDKGSVIPSIRSSLVSYEIKIIKSSETNRRAEISIMPQELTDEEQEPIHIDTWFHLKPTTLTFDSRAITKFEFDLDIEEFFNRISDFNSLDAIAEAPRLLDDLLREKSGGDVKSEKERTIKETILDIIAGDNSLTDRGIQKKAHELGVKCTISHIGQIRRDLELES